MRPHDDPQPQPTVTVPTRQGYSLVSSRTHPAAAARSQSSSQDATANLARQQLDAIYANDPNSLMEVEAEPATEPATVTDHPQPQVQSQPLASRPYLSEEPTPQPEPSIAQPGAAKAPEEPRRFAERTIQPIEKSATPPQSQQATEFTVENPYERTHSNKNLQADPDQWKQYHSAWQQYYQQYFHRYYSGHLEEMHAQLDAETKRAEELASHGREVSPEQAMDDIRSRLRAKVQERATKVRKSRHFVPIMAALGVMLVFTFLQYNRVLFSNIQAYVTPGNIEPANIIVAPGDTTAVSPDPLLIIPKINVQVPVVWNTKPDHNSQMKAMENGVAWFGIPGANSKPGQIGNTVVSGHSSNDFFETGDYKFVFAPLEKLQKDDTIEVHYQGTRYTYVVTKKEVVLPTQVDKLIYHTDKPVLTLITCTPLGTALKRLLVTAEQVSPNPEEAKDAPDTRESSGESAEMPGIGSTLLERAFGQ